MNSKNFVNFHVLISHSPSCLNRDDMNMQKTAVFGGTTRVRVSSQSLKRAMRKSDYYKGHFDGSIRTRRLLDRLAAELAAQQATDEGRRAVEQAALYAAAVFEGKTKPEDIKKYKRADNGTIETQVIPYHAGEIEQLRSVLKDAAEKKETERLGYVRDAIGKMQKEQAKAVTLDVALSGRMANSDLIYDVDGALAVAHALTTHAVEPQDVDWFTAVDDLTQDAGETGAGHLNTQQFSAGVFYRYASLNLKQLQVNLGLLENMASAETPESRTRALQVARHVLRLLATVVPSAKQQSFAAHNLGNLALVSFADQPVSLANAFEKPVSRERDGGYLAPSEKALVEYWQRLNTAYGLDERAGVFRLADTPIPEGVTAFGKLAELESWIERGGD
jgi:CRISPR system Cascade subunit CasC